MQNGVALITGTRKGIGKELAQYYLDQGISVAGCSRGESSIEHEKYFHYQLDVNEEEKVVSMVRDVIKKSGKVDILINNAGIASMNHLLLTPGATVKKIFDTNFLGSFLFLREVSKIMLKQKYGRIVNFATVAAPLNLEGEAIYASSKSAIESLTRIAAKELGETGITVNTVGPTPVLTDLIKNVPQEKMDNLLQQQAIKRFGTFEDIINVIEFFVNPKSDFVTGQVIYLGGVT